MKIIKHTSIGLALLLLIACSDNDNNRLRGGSETTVTPIDSKVSIYSAAILTADPGYNGGGAMQLAKMDYENNSLKVSPEVVSKDKSDYAVSAYGKYFYYIGRFGIDAAYKYAFAEPSTQLWQGDFGNGYDLKGSDNSGNAHDIIFVNETKAYVVRYDSTKVWIVNPSATNESDFKIGELDLSAYDDGDGAPEMKAAKVVGDKLFVVMQRLESWCIGNSAPYVAVFDINTDTEIDVNSSNDPEGLKGIRLQVTNPSTIDYQKDIGVVVSGVGGGTLYCTLANRYSGGIEAVNPSTYTTKLLLDDGDQNTHPYDFISSAKVFDKNNGYFVSYEGHTTGATKLYHFNPSTGDVTGVVAGFDAQDKVEIFALEKAPDGTAWVGTGQDLSAPGGSPKMFVLGAEQNRITEFELERDVSQIAFVVNKKTDKETAIILPPFAPAAGQPDSTAIDANDTAIVAWATGFENYIEGMELADSWTDANRALGFAGNSDGTNKGHSTDIVSLGRGGEITLTFDQPIANGEGYDFAVFENSFSHTFLELAWVEVSSDGVNFYRFPNYSFTENPVGGFNSVDPTNINGLAGKYKGGFGSPFDLEALKGQAGLDVNAITHVKLVDIVGDGAALDSLGQVIYEPYPTRQSAGFDLDAVGVINQAE